MKNAAKAFTLVELLVSMTILVVLTVMFVKIISDVSKIWSTGNQKSDLYQTARATIEMMGRELSVAEPLPAQMQGNFRSYASSPMVINPPLPAGLSLLKDASDAPMDSLFFYAPLKNSAQGPLTCVGYYVSSDHILHRLSVAADNTSYSMAAANLPVGNMWTLNDSGTVPNRLLGRTNKLSQFIDPVWWLNNKTAPWLATAPTKTLVDAASDATVTSPIAERVIGLVLRPFGKDGVALPSPLLLSTASTFTAGSSVGRAYNSAWWPVADALPTEIEITVVICEPNAYQRLKTQGALPVLTLPADNTDSALQDRLNTLKTSLSGKIEQYVVITRRFPILRGSR